MQEDALLSKHWNLGFCLAVVTPNNNGDNSNDDEHSSVASKGSTITILSKSTPASNSNLPSVVVPSSLVCPINPALIEMPPKKRKKVRQSPDNCPILIRWS